MIDWIYEYEERLAIMQFDGGLSKDEAEREATKIINAWRAEVERKELGDSTVEMFEWNTFE